MYLLRSAWNFPMRIAPFGNLGVKVCLQLTLAYRS